MIGHAKVKLQVSTVSTSKQPESGKNSAMLHHTQPGTYSLTTKPLRFVDLLRNLCSSIILITGSALASESSPGSGILELSNAQHSAEAVQLDAQIDLSVNGLLAEMTLTQTFRNNTNEWMNARYVFPMPSEAAVQGLILDIDGRKIEGVVQTRDEARTAYEDAKAHGQIAGLVEQQRPNLFTMNVATVAPGSTIKVTLDIMTPVIVDNRRHSITLPTTHTPRYTNTQTKDPEALLSAFTQIQHSRGPRLKLQAHIATLNDHMAVDSSTHTLDKTPTRIQISDAPMDADIVLSWPAGYQKQSSSQVIVTNDGMQRYAQVLLNPPAETPSESTAKRQLILVVDKSGSMAGDAMTAAKQALYFALDSLNESDSFNIVAFDDQMQSLFKQARPATKKTIQLATRFIAGLKADGGTEMEEALRFSLSQQPGTLHHELTNNELDEQTDAQIRQIVFMTDGSVGYEELLLQRIKRTIGNNRLFTIGIGSAPNQWFLEKAAIAGRGASLSIPNSQNVAEAVNTLLGTLRYPVLTDVSVQFLGGHGELYPSPVPDLYADKPQLLIGKISSAVKQIVVSGKRSGERFTQTLDLADAANELSTNTVDSKKPAAAAMFWTRKKIDKLSDEQRYASDNTLHKEAITQLALNANLVTRYTSFVAIETTPVKNTNFASAQHEVPSLIPKGNTMMNIAVPQGAAGIDTLTILSLLFALTGIAMLYLSRYRLVR